MVILGGSLLALFIVAVLLIALHQASKGPLTLSLSVALKEAMARRETAYEEMKALYHDHQQGAIAEREFRDRFQAYRLLAAKTLWEQKGLEEALSALDLRLEEEIEVLRIAIAPRPEEGKEA